MEKYVYRITNLINNKNYIGQTNNLKRRMKEHLYDERKHKPIHNALKKYGIDNFVIRILYYGENYNEEEKKWIAFYESNNKDKGYNIQSGGEDSSGENNPMSKISQAQADEVIDLLLNTNLSYDEIAEKIGIKKKFIEHINHGDSWKNDNYIYPLRDFSNKLDESLVQEIILLLKDDSKSIDDIVKITHIKRYTILNINRGTSYKQKELSYPIKDISKTKKEVIDKIIYMLGKTKMSYKDIANNTGIPLNTIYRINKGILYYNKELNYPIRENDYRA